MEKRWCERVPVEVKVILLHNGHQLARCAVRDISLCGIRLHSGPLALNRNTLLGIQFPSGKYPQEGPDQINAVVVRNTIDEVALIFEPTEPEMLREIIRHYRKPPRKTGLRASH